MTYNKKNNSLVPIIIIGALFFIFGFITWLNATLIPYLKISCELTTTESYLVTFAFYISYFVMAIPSAKVLEITGFRNGMSIGLLVMALGALIFIPAAMNRTYWLFLIGLFVQGSGLAILQTASNPYVVILGPIESAAKRISIMGFANKVAGIISPIILGAVVLKDADVLDRSIKTLSEIARDVELDRLSEKVIIPYIIISVSLIILAFIISISSLPEIGNKEDSQEENRDLRTSIFQYPYLFLGVASIFLYVGAEVIAVDTIIGYGSYLNFELSEAKFFASFTLGAMVVGYIFGIITIPKILSQETVLKYFTILAILLSFAIIFTSGYTSILMIALLGFANSLMWPAIWPLALNGLGKFTKLGSALLIMGISGGALMPLIYGAIADSFNPQIAYIILVPAYLFILFFAVKGHKINRLKL